MIIIYMILIIDGLFGLTHAKTKLQEWANFILIVYGLVSLYSEMKGSINV
jgi:hypothetical protein